MPRHSPYALYSLNFITLFSINCFSLSIAWVSFDNFSSWIVNSHISLKRFPFALIFSSYPPRTCTSLYFPWRIVVIHDSWKDRFKFLKTVFLNYLFVLLYLLYSVFNEHLHMKYFVFHIRVASQLSCRYLYRLVGSNGLEPSTSRLSGARSNHLSYEPI